MNNIPLESKTIINQSFEFAQSRGLGNEGECIETSATMCNFIRKNGEKCNLKRYESTSKDFFGGHWTLITPYGEFDPTIGCSKSKIKPNQSKCGELYSVKPNSRPYNNWKFEIVTNLLDVEDCIEN